MASKFNIVFEQWATFQHTVTWKDPSGAPIDLTGYRVRMQVRQSPTAAAKLLDFDSDDLDSGMEIGTLDDSGVVSITLSSAITGAMAFKAAEYDITVTSPGGVTTRLVEGKCSVSPGVTR